MITDLETWEAPPRLTAEEEETLPARIKAGDRAATERYIEGNLRLVLKQVRKMPRDKGSLTWEDLFQEGTLGLMHALEKFDWDRGVKFSTYAVPWIRQSISRAIGNKSRIIRIPTDIDELLRKAKNATERLSIELNREPTDEEIADELDLDIDKWRTIQRRTAPAETGWFDDLDRGFPEPDDPAAVEDRIESLYDRLDVLNERQRDVLTLRFGLGDREPLTQKDTGKVLKLTTGYVRQVEHAALDRLREAA